RAGGCAMSRSRGTCMGRRTPAHRPAARHSAVPAMAKQVYGETAAASTPPSDEPTTLMVPQAAPVIAIAPVRSAGPTRLGTPAGHPAAGELAEQPQQRDEHEPVAAEDDQLGGEQPAEVPVGRE